MGRGRAAQAYIMRQGAGRQGRQGQLGKACWGILGGQGQAQGFNIDLVVARARERSGRSWRRPARRASSWSSWDGSWLNGPGFKLNVQSGFLQSMPPERHAGWLGLILVAGRCNTELLRESLSCLWPRLGPRMFLGAWLLGKTVASTPGQSNQTE